MKITRHEAELLRELISADMESLEALLEDIEEGEEAVTISDRNAPSYIELLEANIKRLRVMAEEFNSIKGKEFIPIRQRITDSVKNEAYLAGKIGAAIVNNGDDIFINTKRTKEALASCFYEAQKLQELQAAKKNKKILK